MKLYVLKVEETITDIETLATEAAREDLYFLGNEPAVAQALAHAEAVAAKRQERPGRGRGSCAVRGLKALLENGRPLDDGLEVMLRYDGWLADFKISLQPADVCKT